MIIFQAFSPDASPTISAICAFGSSVHCSHGVICAPAHPNYDGIAFANSNVAGNACEARVRFVLGDLLMPLGSHPWLFLIVVAGVLTVSLGFAFLLLMFTACALGFLFIINLIDAAESGTKRTAEAETAWTRLDGVRFLGRLRQVTDWRLLVVGFAAGRIPQLPVNLALLVLSESGAIALASRPNSTARAPARASGT